MAVSWNDVAVRAWPDKEQEQHRLPREILNRRCGDAACGDVSNVPGLPGNQGCHPIPNLPAHTGRLSLPCSLVPGPPCRHLPCFPLSQCLDHFGSSFQRGLGKSRAKDPSTGTGQQLCAPAAHQPRAGASTKTSPRSAAASLSPAVRDMGAATRPLRPLPLL